MICNLIEPGICMDQPTEPNFKVFQDRVRSSPLPGKYSLGSAGRIVAPPQSRRMIVLHGWRQNLNRAATWRRVECVVFSATDPVFTARMPIQNAIEAADWVRDLYAFPYTDMTDGMVGFGPDGVTVLVRGQLQEVSPTEAADLVTAKIAAVVTAPDEELDGYANSEAWLGR